MGQKDDDAMTQEGFKKFRRRRSREQAAAEQSKFARAADQSELTKATEAKSSANERVDAPTVIPAVSKVRISEQPMTRRQEHAPAVQSAAKAPPLQLNTPVIADRDEPDGRADAYEAVSRLRRRVKPAPHGKDAAKQTVQSSPHRPSQPAHRVAVESKTSVAEPAPVEPEVSKAPKFDAAKVRVVKRRKQPQQTENHDHSAVLPTKYDPWLQLPEVSFDFLGQRPSRLPLVSAFRTSPTARAFDLLRTRLIHSLKDHGWKRVAITSPSANGGTTFCAVNLALSLARIPGSRNILMDMNFRNPGVAAALGIPAVGNMGDFLAGKVTVSDHLLRLSDSLAVATNCHADENASDIFHDSRTGDVITSMIDECYADTVLFDLPPVLEHDDVTAFLPQVDGVLLISDGEQTTAKQLASCEKMLAGHAPLLGVVLNRAQQTDKTQVTP